MVAFYFIKITESGVFMYSELMKSYKETFSSIGFIEGTWLEGTALPIAAVLLVLTIVAFSAFTGYLDDIIKRKIIAKHGEDSDYFETRYKNKKTSDLLYKYGKMVTASFVILLLMTVGYFYSATNSTDTIDELEGIKVRILDTVMSDYLENADYEPIKTDSVIGLNFYENKYNLYNASFIHEDIRYKNKTIYFTYIDSLPSNVLIPFNPDLYSDLIPSETERNAKTTGAISGKEGYKYYSSSENSTLKRISYIDDIDYIYNIKTEGD